MVLPVGVAKDLIESLQEISVDRLLAQAKAKQVLLEVHEDPSNFPRFDPLLDDKITFIAYSLLGAGASFAEHGLRSEASAALDRAAALIQQIHLQASMHNKASGFHVLISAMAFYAAGQYSKSYVAIRFVEGQSPAGKAIAAFLRKDMKSLIGHINSIILPVGDAPDDIEKAICILLARSLNLVMDFIYSGNDTALIIALQNLTDAVSLAELRSLPDWWWLARLMKIIISDLHESSPWYVLPPFFPRNKQDILDRYIRLLAFLPKNMVFELWISQRAALPVALLSSNLGAVINLRTSGGKTRVAELAILQTLLSQPSSKVLYLAPFRSLALEIEQSLESTFRHMGFIVSHLYGGSRVSSIDASLAAESSITIATPEKAKSLLRAVPTLMDQVRLIIIDEGHLFGLEPRLIRNEVFVEHIRVSARKVGARVLLLSAVMPNAQQIAEWIADDKDNLATSRWKPSSERFGFLQWNGKRVKLDWLGDFPSFNPSFVTSKPLKIRTRRRKPFPSDKAEAIASAAVRLSSSGPVMIFNGMAKAVPGIAKAAILALENEGVDHCWPEHEWDIFLATCEEYLPPNAIEVAAARSGVICHTAQLPGEVRLAMERLMRASPPRIIVATTTLAQGVNVGVSTVIIANPYISGSPVGKNTFWNICGRAGRAYVDGEGKILYAIDETREDWQIRSDYQLAQSYFNEIVVDPVESGILGCIRQIKALAANANVSFERLIEMIAEDDLSLLGEIERGVEQIFDLIDDEILSMHMDQSTNPGDDDSWRWIDDVFRKSLAGIQARSSTSDTTDEDLIAVLKARSAAILKRVPSVARKTIVASSLPLRVAMKLQSDLAGFYETIDRYSETGSMDALREVIVLCEDWARVNAGGLSKDVPPRDVLDKIRDSWFNGVALKDMLVLCDKVFSICSGFYGYLLPWVIHSVAQQIRNVEAQERSEVLDRIALLVELGVPNDIAAKVYMAGVRSRVAATQIAQFLTTMVPDVLFLGVRDIARRMVALDLIAMSDGAISPLVSKWLMFLKRAHAHEPANVPMIPSFSISDMTGAGTLYVRHFEDRLFFCSPDFRQVIPFQAHDEFPVEVGANVPDVVFQGVDSVWNMVIRNPRLTKKEER